jgi:isoleucyl-tRNA synthetase
VHLSDYPSPAGRVDAALNEGMDAARRIVELGRRVRTETKVRVRQPLLEAVVHHPGDHEALMPLLDLVAEELNVKEVRFAESSGGFGRWRAKPNFKVLGPRLGGRVSEVAAALRELDPDVMVVAAGGTLTLGDLVLTPEDVDLTQETLEGWGVATEGGITVALELELTPELRREGLARELVRAIQDARKAAGLDVSDRIALGLSASGNLAEAADEHRAWVSGETLATQISDGEVDGATYRQVTQVEGSELTISLRRV